MTKRNVLDTNVYISALFWKGSPHDLFERIIDVDFLNFISPQILDEVENKLLDKFKLPILKARKMSETIVFSSEIVYPKRKFNIVKNDPSDNKIIECAIEADASFIVSGGKKHLLNIKQYKDCRVPLFSDTNYALRPLCLMPFSEYARRHF